MNSYLCGCYYHLASTEYHIRIEKHYLPLVNSEVHSKILSTTSRTVLKQTFTNPSKSDAISECIYTFPLFDGVSVVDFTCKIGDKVLRGLVKEKAKAKEVFDNAVARGETAGLLEQAPESSDVFSTKLGNIPAGGSVVVEITYIGELKHHDSDGIRFTIPTKIAPRYGSAPSLQSSVFSSRPANDSSGIQIIVDVNMPDGSFIKGIQSPSHLIAVSMGAVSTAANADPTMSKASATLSLGSAALEKDFVLIVQSKDVGTPKAILETHPTIPNHRALMATLVPKFSLPPSRPEIVFVADRSGSMAGNIESLVSAMTVFLKSIPTGVKFNICSFGTSYSFLWKKSKSYSQETLNEATNHLKTFSANMGGTQTFAAIKATIEQRFTDIPLEIMLLTDGDIWQQEELFSYLNQQVEQSNGNIRVFPLGIGNGVSHSLIEGVARAGNGFAQAVQIGERLDSAVVRMLRGALSPHITNYTLEVKYGHSDDDFELLDSVTESLKVLLSDDDDSVKPQPSSTKATISLFDSSVDPEKEDIKNLNVSLPKITIPKLLQAPNKIPSLFAFSRTTVYLLMSPDTIQRNPTAVVLRATSAHGPLALEIPIESLSEPGQTIHQLAAKKAVQDLEEGRGWLCDAKDQAGTLIKNKYPSCFDDLVKQEAVRLGEEFQVAGKWCSFVAVSDNDKEIEEKETTVSKVTHEGGMDSLLQYLRPSMRVNHSAAIPSQTGIESRARSSLSRFRKGQSSPQDTGFGGGLGAPPVPLAAASYSPSASAFGASAPGATLSKSAGNGLFGAASPSAPSTAAPGLGGRLFGMAAPAPPPPPALPAPSPAFGLQSTGSTPAYSKSEDLDNASLRKQAKSSSRGGNVFARLHSSGTKGTPERRTSASSSSASSASSLTTTDWAAKSTTDKVHALISLQDFSGAWSTTRKDGGTVLPFSVPAAPDGVELKVWITLLVVKFLEEKCADEEGTWALVVEKARSWLEGEGVMDLETLEGKAGEVVMKD